MFESRDAFPFVEALEQHWQVIRDEATALPVDLYRPWAVTDNYVGMWRMAGLVDKGDGPLETDEMGRAIEVRPHCPKTMALLVDIPGLTCGGYSVLEPGTEIIPHRDNYDEGIFFRLHLGLSVPDGCELRVGDEWRQHENGRGFVFNTSIEHEARNRSDLHRLILIFDVRASAYPEVSTG